MVVNFVVVVVAIVVGGCGLVVGGGSVCEDCGGVSTGAMDYREGHNMIQ